MVEEKDFGRYMIKENKIEGVPEVFGDSMKINHYYDMPLDYTYRDKEGQYYIVNCIGWEEKEREETFIIIPVTKEEESMYDGERVLLKDIINKLDLGIMVRLAVYNGSKEKQSYYEYTLRKEDVDYLNEVLDEFIENR